MNDHEKIVEPMVGASDHLPENGVQRRRGALIPLVIGALALSVLALGAFMVWRADSKTNKIALSSSPKPVSVVVAKASTFRASRTYVGTLEPWVEAKVGPQLVSAYVDTVLVRPGDVVQRGQVLATLDCRNASAANQGVAMQARAIDEKQKAIAHESARIQGLLDGGFVSPNEAEQKTAQSAEQEAQLLATKSRLVGTTLEVNDCILRAPFSGEISGRMIDPGAFVRPGTAIVSVVDRSIIRLSADAPEIDFAVISPTTKVGVRIFATGREMTGSISRRTPSADPGTRTLHFEIDLQDPKREIPVNTTGEIRIEVGEAVPATEIPLSAASIRNAKATIFVVENNVAKVQTVALRGEIGGSVYLDPQLKAGSLIVTEGRALLVDGDSVTAKETGAPPAPPPSASTPKPEKQ